MTDPPFHTPLGRQFMLEWGNLLVADDRFAEVRAALLHQMNVEGESVQELPEQEQLARYIYRHYVIHHPNAFRAVLRRYLLAQTEDEKQRAILGWRNPPPSEPYWWEKPPVPDPDT